MEKIIIIQLIFRLLIDNVTVFDRIAGQIKFGLFLKTN